MSEKPALENELKSGNGKPVFVYTTEGDFLALDPKIKEMCQVLIKYKDRIVILNKKDSRLVVTLP